MYPGWDIMFKFVQGHVSKTHPITVLVLLSESISWHAKIQG